MNRLHALLGLGAASPGGAGILVSAARVCGRIYVSALVPQQMQLEELRQESRQLVQRARLSENEAPQAPAEQLAAFMASSRRPATCPMSWRRFSAPQAAGAGPGAGRISRRFKDSVGRLMRYQITLPVRGTYPQSASLWTPPGRGSGAVARQASSSSGARSAMRP